MTRSILSALLLSLFAACAVDDAPADIAPVPDEAVFYETIVQLHADGTSTVAAPHAVTAGEQRAQNARRLAIEAGEATPTESIVQDAGCADDSVWLYSRTDFTGDRICFSGTGPVFLEEYYRFITINGVPRFAGDWRISSGGYWPGALGGKLSNHYDFNDDDALRWSLNWPRWGGRQAFTEPNRALFLAQRTTDN